MTPTLDNSLTLVRPSQDAAIDYRTFEDAERHFVIRSRRVADAFHDVARAEADVRRLRVGGPSADAEVEFWLFDLKRDKELRRKLLDNYNAILRGVLDRVSNEVSTNPDLIDGPNPTLDELADLIALRRFVANAVALSRRKRGRVELLFHHITD